MIYNCDYDFSHNFAALLNKVEVGVDAAIRNIGFLPFMCTETQIFIQNCPISQPFSYRVMIIFVVLGELCAMKMPIKS